MTPDQPKGSTHKDVPASGPLSDPGAHNPPADLDYELIRLIGRGSYGEVWLVRDRSGNHRACKLVYRESFREERPYEREYAGIRNFEPVSSASESQLKILSVGRRDAAGCFFYIMELADDIHTGQTIHPDSYVPRTLRSELNLKKRLPVSECVQIGLSLSAALENLHRHGLIHRDIKPGNIVFVNGVPKLADIGLVTDMDMTVSYVGTEGFIPPEGPTSQRADIYGLGKVLYEIGTGKDRLEYPELPANFAEIPDWDALLELNAVISKACETNPARRYASAEELHADLAALAAGKSIRRRRAAGRRRALVARTVAVVCAIGLVAGGIFYFSKYVSRRESDAVTKSGQPRIPVPDAARMAECGAKLKETYREQLSNGKADAKQQVAAELVKRAGQADPAMELASLQMAAQLTVEATDFSKAMEICEREAERFQIEILPVKAELLSLARNYAHATRDWRDLTEECVAAGLQAIAADDYADAGKFSELGQAAAPPSGVDYALQEAKFLAEETALCSTAFEPVKKYAAVLREKPDDPEANLVVGKFRCFVKNDWLGGVPLLARGNDEALRQIAKQELEGKLRSPQQQIELGDAWWKRSTGAADEAYYQARARYWYLKGIANSREPAKSSLREQLAARIKAVVTRPGGVRIVSRVGGSETIDIYSDEVQWKGGRRGAVGNKLNHVVLGEFNSGDLEVVRNCGTTWLIPDAVDFSTARLTIEGKPSRRNKSDLAIFDDHVRVTLAHQPAGAATIQVNVTFGSPP